MSNIIYIGNFCTLDTSRDVEAFFRSFGRIRHVVLKNDFGFVEFENSQDADKAFYELKGTLLLGERVVSEFSRRGGSYDGEYDGNYGGGRRAGTRASRYGSPIQTRYRLLVTNLSTHCSWQDLKDLMRGAGEVSYAEAHKKVKNEAVVCFSSHEDLRRAIDRYQGKEINGRRIKLVDDTEAYADRKRRFRSPTRSRSRSS